jgi:hypothetical protein
LRIGKDNDDEENSEIAAEGSKREREQCVVADHCKVRLTLCFAVLKNNPQSEIRNPQ